MTLDCAIASGLMKRFLRNILVLIVITLPMTGHAEIEKYSNVCQTGICFHWWPKLPVIEGWHQDEEQSRRESVNALAPDGHTFVNAETVMYAKAEYKPRVPESKTLDEFIENDKKTFSDVLVTPAPDLVTADGQKIRTFLFTPKQSGNWERIGYGEENDAEKNEYFLIFAISSRSRNGLQKSMKDFEKLIQLYKTAPSSS